MNKKLLLLFKLISARNLQLIKDKHYNSPLILSTIHFLENLKSETFADETIIQYLYKNSLNSTPFVVLKNRYYKLRKKLLEILAQESATEASQIDKTPNLFSKEEIFIYEVLRTKKYNDTWTVIKERLLDLEKEAWENNRFEMVDLILEAILVRSANINVFPEYQIIRRKRKSSAILADLNRLKNFHRELFILRYRYGNKVFIDYMKDIVSITKKYPQYPRFKSISNYFFASYKMDSLKSSNVKSIAKNIIHLKKHLDQYPNIPLLNDSQNQVEESFTRISYILMNYAYISGNPYDYEKYAIDRLERFSKIAGITLTEGEFLNVIMAMLHKKNYKAAYSYLSKAKDYYRIHRPKHESILMVVIEARVICYSYPNIKSERTDIILDKLLTWLKQPDSKKSYILYSTMHTDIAKLYLIKKNYKQALRMIETEPSRLIIKEYFDYNLFLGLFKLYAGIDIKFNLQKELNISINNEKNLGKIDEYEWLQKMYDYYKTLSLAKKFN